MKAWPIGINENLSDVTFLVYPANPLSHHECAQSQRRLNLIWMDK